MNLELLSKTKWSAIQTCELYRTLNLMAKTIHTQQPDMKRTRQELQNKKPYILRKQTEKCPQVKTTKTQNKYHHK